MKPLWLSITALAILLGALAMPTTSGAQDGCIWAPDPDYPGFERCLREADTPPEPVDPTPEPPVDPTPEPPVDPTPEPPVDPVGTWVETFDTPESLDRFDYGIHHAWVWGDTHDTWIADHTPDCGPPDPGRVINNPTAIDGQTYYPDLRGDVAYWCRGHLMTAFNSNHYAQVDFSPKVVFPEVNRVCWDQNRTDMGARQWVQMVIVPLDTFEANGRRLDYVSSRLAASPGPGAFGLQVTGDTFLFALSDGGTITQTGSSSDANNSGNWTTTDKAQRFQICVEDLNNGTIQVTLEHDTGVQTRIMAGAFPDGPARVIFQDDTYNADKDQGVPGAVTWHWDNLMIG